MGSYVSSNLIAGEEVIYETGPHPIIYLSPAALIVSRRRAGCFVGEPACTVSISRSDTDSSISP